jgi:betaine reductase
MDVRSQEAVLSLAKQHGKDAILVLLGSPDPESAEIAAETVVLGDPSWAGPLAGAQLGLHVHHVLDPLVRQEIPTAVWDEQIGVMADVLDAEGVTKAVEQMRQKGNPS